MRDQDRPEKVPMSNNYEMNYGSKPDCMTDDSPEEFVTLIKNRGGTWGAYNKTKEYVLEELGPDEMLACVALILLGVERARPLEGWKNDLLLHRRESAKHDRIKKILKQAKGN